jgi:NADH:ubiquinone oxidoreductase subunit E
MALEQIAELLGIPIEEVQRLSKSYAHLEEV